MVAPGLIQRPPQIVDGAGDAIAVGTGNTIRGLDIGAVPAANHRITGSSVGTLTITETDLPSGTGGIIEVTTGG